jgi:Pyridine nucleotide-disulphide oxidoreductase
MYGAQGVEMTNDKDILAGSTVAAEGDRKHRVVIIGGGFAGIHAAKALAKSAVDVTLIDRRNHHTFQPLLYQVALAVLPTSDIASPIRTILRMARNVEVVMDEVVNFDLKNRQVFLDSGIQLKYDYLIVATGATHSYFGHNEWEEHAPGLKTIDDALEIRRRVLLAYELAERDALETGTQPPQQRRQDRARSQREESTQARSPAYCHSSPRLAAVATSFEGIQAEPNYNAKLNSSAVVNTVTERMSTIAPNSPLINRVHHKYSAAKKVRSSDAYKQTTYCDAPLVVLSAMFLVCKLLMLKHAIFLSCFVVRILAGPHIGVKRTTEEQQKLPYYPHPN